jgi:putative transposase
VKRRLVVEAEAHVHDPKRLATTREAIVVARPQPTAEAPQHRCWEKGDDTPTGHQAAVAHHDTPHMRRIGEETCDRRRRKRYPAPRWGVERPRAWLSKCRALFVRYDKHAGNFLGLLQLACALLWLRRRARLIRD